MVPHRAVCLAAFVCLGIGCQAQAPHSEEPKLLHTLEGHKGLVSTVAFSPDGKALVSGSWDRTVKLWDVVNGKFSATLQENMADPPYPVGGLNKRQDGMVGSVSFSRDGKIIASGNEDGTIHLLDAASRKEMAIIEADNHSVAPVTFSPDDKTLVSSSRWIKLWDRASGKNTGTLELRTWPRL